MNKQQQQQKQEHNYMSISVYVLVTVYNNLYILVIWTVLMFYRKTNKLI